MTFTVNMCVCVCNKERKCQSENVNSLVVHMIFECRRLYICNEVADSQHLEPVFFCHKIWKTCAKESPSVSLNILVLDKLLKTAFKTSIGCNRSSEIQTNEIPAGLN